MQKGYLAITESRYFSTELESEKEYMLRRTSSSALLFLQHEIFCTMTIYIKYYTSSQMQVIGKKLS